MLTPSRLVELRLNRYSELVDSDRSTWEMRVPLNTEAVCSCQRLARSITLRNYNESHHRHT